MDTRIYSLINFMLENDRYVTLSELSECVNMSVPTIRLDLVKVEDVLEDTGVRIKRKRGVGIKLHGEENLKYELRKNIKNKLNAEDNQITSLDTEILKILVRDIRNGTKISKIAEELFLSEFPIQKSLDKLKVLLLDYDLNLVTRQGKGVFLLGEEIQIRKLSSNIHFTDHEENYIYKNPSDVQERIMSSLGVDPKYIIEAIRSTEEKLDVKFSDESFQSLLIHISIALNRVYSGSQIEEETHTNTDINEDIYKATIDLYKRIEAAYNIEFNSSELYYGYLHIISTGVTNSEINYNLLVERIDTNIMHISKSIKYLIESVLNIEVEEENFNNLVLHLRPMINRLEHNMQIKNPLLENIKREYPEAYGIAWMCNPIFVRELDREVSEDEVAYIALHIQTMIDKERKDLNVVIVCSSGIGVSQLLKSQIESRLKNVNILETYSIAEFNKSNHKDVDLVISTFPIDTHIPQIVVNSILGDDDTTRIKNFVNNPKSSMLQQNVPYTLCKNKLWKSKEEVLKEVSKILENQGDVKNEFFDSLLAREEIGSTEIGNYIAIPHGDFKYVNKTQIMFVTLENKILWEEYEVDVIIFILIKEEDKTLVSRNLKKLYKNLHSEDFRSQIKNIENIEELELV